MLFVTLNSQQVSSYSYACNKLHTIENKMMTARKKLEEIAAVSNDKFFSKCIYMFNSEALQLENEIHAQIESFNCSELTPIKKLKKKVIVPKVASPSLKNIQSLYNYVEKNYIQSYKQLLEDEHLNYSLKNLINTHLKILSANLTQLKLFMEVSISVN